MQIKWILSSCLMVLFSGFGCSNSTCSKETISALQSQFKRDYLNWKEALNYMDHEVIQMAYKNMDSSYANMEACTTYPKEFLVYADSISAIYVANKIKETELEQAESLILYLDTILVQADE